MYALNTHKRQGVTTSKDSSLGQILSFVKNMIEIQKLPMVFFPYYIRWKFNKVINLKSIGNITLSNLWHFKPNLIGKKCQWYFFNLSSSES
jgi:hypothetical protein